ncbi:MAG: hypothetical protein OEY14_19135 [Myxococcales bacterium]|nr:hypothetical protein [Myxococcales bacterium]
MAKTLRSLFALGLVCVATIAPSNRLEAQDRADAPPVREGVAIVVGGQVHRPRAFYVLPRSEPGSSEAELRTTFVPEIVRALERESF